MTKNQNELDNLNDSRDALCPNHDRCGGCSLWRSSIDQQLEQKRRVLFEKLQAVIQIDPHLSKPDEIKCFSVGRGFHRLWFDFQIRGQQMGLFDKNGDLLDLNKCYLLDPKLQGLYQTLRKIKFPKCKISARLRISPAGVKGLWLDMANIEVKNLLEEKTVLSELSEILDVIEIGQRRKRLIKIADRFKLSDPQPEVWFKTLNFDLYGYVGAFTQPSLQTGDELVRNVLNWASRTDAIFEFGSGLGQYTVPLLDRGKRIFGFENNSLAQKALIQNSILYSQNLVLNPNQHELSPELFIKSQFLVNPPRSGLGSFVDLIMEKNPEQIIYISCHPDSLARDLKVLSKNYCVSELKIVDQFPNSHHFESAVLLKRKT